MKHFLRNSLLLTTIAICLYACKKNVTEESMHKAVSLNQDVLQPSTYSKLADTLEKRLANTVGYAFVIHHNGALQVKRAKGYARLPMDGARAMDVNVKYSTASVSKTITAAALMRVFSMWPNVSAKLDEPIWTYLPSHWKPGANIKTITFRQLLDHTSGFRNTMFADGSNDGNNCTYGNLKLLVEAGIDTVNKVPSYNNRNYALLRLLIPAVANYSIIKYEGNYEIFSFQNVQAMQYANAYMHYCRTQVFANVPAIAGTDVYCKSIDQNPGLVYGETENPGPGWLLPDFTLSSGGQGWVLSTAQVADFFRTLHYTESIIPKSLADMMSKERLGYDQYANTADGVPYFWKNGIYTAGYRSLIIGFGDGTQITIMANSPINLQNAAIQAHEAWYARGR